MDYGKRPYASPSEDYKTFTSEITDQYVKSIGGVAPAGLKRPYVYNDYNSMQYLFNTTQQYLGGRPPTLEDLGQPIFVPTIPPKFLPQLLIMNFEGSLYNESDYTWTRTADSDGISNAWSKFGAYSFVSKPSSNELKCLVPEGELYEATKFTLHFWERMTIFNGYVDNFIYFKDSDSNNELIRKRYNPSPIPGEDISTLIWSVGGSTTTISFADSSLDTTYHYALVKDGTVAKLYRDGVLVCTLNRPAVTDPVTPLYVTQVLFSNTYDSNFYIDALELTNYVKWTNNFTPPTSAPKKGTI
jgi:hypothetical protein